jgi:hypothetical protein
MSTGIAAPTGCTPRATRCAYVLTESATIRSGRAGIFILPNASRTVRLCSAWSPEPSPQPYAASSGTLSVAATKWRRVVVVITRRHLRAP